MRYLPPFIAEDDFTAVLLRKDVSDPVKISGAVSDAMRHELDQRHSGATPECAEAYAAFLESNRDRCVCVQNEWNCRALRATPATSPIPRGF